MYLGFSRILLICTIFIQLLQTDCRTTTKRRDRVRRTLFSATVELQKKSTNLNIQKADIVGRLKSTLKPAKIITRRFRNIKLARIKADAQEIEKEELRGHAGGKAGVFGHMRNIWKSFGQSMVDFFFVFLDGIRKIFKRKGVSQKALKQNAQVDDLKLLAWELLVNPTKQDSVVTDLLHGDPLKEPGMIFNLLNGKVTPLVKSHFDSEKAKLGITDITGMAGNYPKGWKDFEKTLETLEQKKAFSDFENKLVEVLQKIPSKSRPRITQVAKKYQEERSSQKYGSSSKVA
ncbi:hypothetical protein CROQUDRAFT_715743 [Cronartium quercuum f. sp. fusiforme G11]|uniref:Uncharacterized protein n=1 Tax=Cronartium quercuum f. sp. fusiforme G11 TaxID=708437 RepID=A0A9P6NHK7_9BASI|nr:hypothetical protein CROQUDRAFT_715743 [Cronartium quercuum f. sp. fusiforme G11]